MMTYNQYGRRRSPPALIPMEQAASDMWMDAADIDDDDDSAFFDDDLESSWDQLRMRQFKEPLYSNAVPPPTSNFSKLSKKVLNFGALQNLRLDKYEKVLILLSLFLIVDCLILTILLYTFPLYRDFLAKLGFNVVTNSSTFIEGIKPKADL